MTGRWVTPNSSSGAGVVVIPFSEAEDPEESGLAMLRPGYSWVSWMERPERQMGPGFWALGKREPDMCAQPAPPEWGSLPRRADGGEQAHSRGGEGNEPMKAASGGQNELLNSYREYQMPGGPGYQVKDVSQWFR